MGLKNVPGFEPDEEALELLEQFFIEGKKEEKSVPISTNIVPGKRHRVKIPEAPVQTPEQEEKSVQQAQKELDMIYEEFEKFAEKISDTVLYSYLYSEFRDLVQAFDDMEAILTDAFNKEDITSYGSPHYERARKIRARILHDIQEKYEKK